MILFAYREQPVIEHNPKMYQRKKTVVSECYFINMVKVPCLGESYYLPDSMNTTPAKQAILALAFSEPPTLVHFIPNRAIMEPKKPRLTAAIISPLHAWI